MENIFIQMVNDISNLSNAVKHKEFDANLRGKWNNYLNEMNSIDFNVVNFIDLNVSFSNLM